MRGRLAHRSLDQVAHTQLGGRGAAIYRLELVDVARIPAGDREPAKAHERSDQGLRDPVGEVFLRGIVAEVGEGQHGNAGSAAMVHVAVVLAISVCSKFSRHERIQFGNRSRIGAPHQRAGHALRTWHLRRFVLGRLVGAAIRVASIETRAAAKTCEWREVAVQDYSRTAAQALSGDDGRRTGSRRRVQWTGRV